MMMMMVLVLLDLLPAGEGKTAESAEYGDIEADVIPMPGVEWFVNPDVCIEESDDQGYRCQPAMPYTP